MAEPYPRSQSLFAHRRVARLRRLSPFLDLRYSIPSKNSIYIVVIHASFLLCFQIIIPISLYVSVEIVKLGQVFFIQTDIELYHAKSDTPAKCRALNINEDLGQIEYVFSDKTGTLTENRMVFRTCSIAGRSYGSPVGSKCASWGRRASLYTWTRLSQQKYYRLRLLRRCLGWK